MKSITNHFLNFNTLTSKITKKSIIISIIFQKSAKTQNRHLTMVFKLSLMFFSTQTNNKHWRLSSTISTTNIKSMNCQENFQFAFGQPNITFSKRISTSNTSTLLNASTTAIIKLFILMINQQMIQLLRCMNLLTAVNTTELKTESKLSIIYNQLEGLATCSSGHKDFANRIV